MIIVTGGAGFIGSALVWALNKRGMEDVLIVDHLGNSAKWRNLRALRFIDYMEKDDFRAEFNLDHLAAKEIDAIIHLGACSSTTEYDASYLIDNNYRYSVELAEYAARNNIRFLYASSAATYGDGKRGYSDDEETLENLRPLNIYGYSKQLFDLWVKKSELLKSFTGFKFTNVFGPNEWHKQDMRSVICKAFRQIRESGKVQLFKSHHPDYTDGEQKRDFLYVKDAVEMIIHCLEKDISGIYNIGSGRAETWNSLVSAIFSALDTEPRIEYIDMPENLREKYQYYTCAEMEKLRKTGCPVKPRPLRDAIADYVCCHLIPDAHLGDEA